MQNNFDILTDNESKKVKLVFKAFIVGIIASVISVCYRYALAEVEDFSFFLYGLVRENLWSIPLLFIGLALVGLIVGKVIEKEPFAGGSGIPQVKAVMGGYLPENPFKIIIAKFVGGVLSIGSGLSLGREGPSVQLGACVGDMVSKKFKSSKLERRLLMSSGASAGLAAAFNAPLAGALFSLEEIYKYLSPLVLLATITAAVASDFVSKYFFGFNPVFDFSQTHFLPLKYYGLLIILGIILGVGGVFYNWLTLQWEKMYAKLKINLYVKVVITFITAGIVGLVFPIILCGGHSLIEELTPEKSLGILFVMLIAKFLFSIFSFASGVPGGIFFPLLIIGANIGAIFAYFSIHILGVPVEYFNTFIIVAMAGYFTSIVRAPITGIILITEMTCSLNHLLALTVVCITSYIVADSLKSAPIYDSLLENLLIKNHVKNKEEKHSPKKIIISSTVHYGSKLDNKYIKDIDFPKGTLVVSINRGTDSFVPNGNTLIKAGDELLTMADEGFEWQTREELEELSTV